MNYYYIALAVLVWLGGFILGASIFYTPSNTSPEPIKKCMDGKLYEVTHEGNITIYDKQAFMTCEEG